MPIFAVTYRYEAAQSEEREANKPAHREWLSARVDDGSIRSVGPFVDGSGALLLVEADDDEAARSLVNDDPHCLRGMVSEIVVREWMPVFGALT
ncbi:YciI family protein [Dietzia sp. B32]|uniref:YciI family protein n=1 Tax=Dietzia sp. B32 TaxID=2915130 RepID=UPI0021ADEA11|nr:YciI family protein [Dietzia sp. B32]UVE95599.1 YciI family protein [Dietzia sp. B32]